MSVERELQKELNDVKNVLKRMTDERLSLTKAIWDMLNYANIFVLLLNSNMFVTLANWYLATKLGFVDEKEIVGKNWLDFIKKEEKILIKNVHKIISTNSKEAIGYREMTNDIVSTKGEIITVKWFNTHINHEFNMTFSFGLQSDIGVDVSELSLRSYYRDIIEKDKTMIKALRDSAVNLSIDGKTDTPNFDLIKID